MQKFRHIVNLTILILLYFTISSQNLVKAEELNNNSKVNMLDFSDLTEKLMPSVVNISTTQKRNKSSEYVTIPQGLFSEEMQEYFEKFGIFPPNLDDERLPKRNLVSLGSGFIVDKDGYIVTNYHVIADADEIAVTLSNEEEYKAKLLGFDVKTDLALLKISPKKPLPAVNFGNSDKVKVGQWIIAIGNPFGFGGSVTTGIISAKSRDIGIGSSIVNNFIQTDAAINKGNSGGPMFNLQGEVIGVNTAIFSPSGNNIGIGFATPSSIAQDVIDQLKKNGKIERGWLGVKIQKITSDIAESLGLETGKGALVAEVIKNGPAEKSGIKVGDIIINFDNKEVQDTNSLPRMTASTPIGKNVDIVVIRGDKKLSLKLIVGKLVEEVDNLAEKDIDNNQPSHKAFATSEEFFGTTLSEINDELRLGFSINSSIKGLVIVKVKRDSLWLDGKIPVKKGDVITMINQQEMTSLSDMKKAINKAKKEKNKFILALINRNGQTLFVPLKISQ